MASEQRCKNLRRQRLQGEILLLIWIFFFFFFSRRPLAKWLLRAVPLTSPAPGKVLARERRGGGRGGKGGKEGSPQRAGNHQPGRNYKANKGEILDGPRP